MLTTPLDRTAFEKSLDTDRLVVVVIGAKWSRKSCLMMPLWEDVSEKYSGRVNFMSIDVDSAYGGDLCTNYDVMTVPAMLLFRDGKEIDRLVGMSHDMPEYVSLINQHLQA